MHVTVTSLHMCGGRTVPLCMFMSVDQYTEIMNREFCQLWIPIGRGVEFLNFCVARCSCVLYSKQVTKTTFISRFLFFVLQNGMATARQ